MGGGGSVDKEGYKSLCWLMRLELQRAFALRTLLDQSTHLMVTVKASLSRYLLHTLLIFVLIVDHYAIRSFVIISMSLISHSNDMFYILPYLTPIFHMFSKVLCVFRSSFRNISGLSTHWNKVMIMEHFDIF